VKNGARSVEAPIVVHMRPRSRGFSLVELMIVVVVLGILASLGMVGYKRYVGKARTTEAAAMLAEMAAKEQIYYLEFAQFLPLVNGSTVTAAAASGASATENANQFWPRDPSVSTFESVRSAAAATALPLSWQLAAVRPRDNVLYCTYFASAGLSGSNPVAGSLGGGLLGSTAIGQPWFYALGACNLTGTATFSTGVTSFAITYDSPTLKALNEGK
jgi:prepilin-type N-terminal cleavage/methylation domain-containing protein